MLLSVPLRNDILRRQAKFLRKDLSDRYSAPVRQTEIVDIGPDRVGMSGDQEHLVGIASQQAPQSASHPLELRTLIVCKARADGADRVDGTSSAPPGSIPAQSVVLWSGAGNRPNLSPTVGYPIHQFYAATLAGFWSAVDISRCPRRRTKLDAL